MIHGSNTADVETHFQKILQENPDIDIEKLQWERKQVKTFITGVKEMIVRLLSRMTGCKVVVFCQFRLL